MTKPTDRFDHGERVEHDEYGKAVVEYDYGAAVCVDADGRKVRVDRGELRSLSTF